MTRHKRERIESIEVKDGDVTFYFEDTKGSFNAREYWRWWWWGAPPPVENYTHIGRKGENE